MLCKSLTKYDLTYFFLTLLRGGSTYKSSWRVPPPQQDQILSFLHRKAPVSEVGAPSNEGWRPPNRKSWIRPCSCHGSRFYSMYVCDYSNETVTPTNVQVFIVFLYNTPGKNYPENPAPIILSYV